jgi:hypothetical protein
MTYLRPDFLCLQQPKPHSATGWSRSSYGHPAAVN